MVATLPLLLTADAQDAKLILVANAAGEEVVPVLILHLTPPPYSRLPGVTAEAAPPGKK